MLRATHGHLASKNENKRQKNIGRWFELMTAGIADKVALYWYAVPSVLTHRSWCGDYTHTHTCTRTAWTQHSHEHMHPRTHATLTRTHVATHARNTHTHARNTHTHTRNTHTHTRTHACTHQYTTRPTHTLTLKCSTYTCMRTHQALTDTYTTGDSLARAGALSRLRKFVFI